MDKYLTELDDIMNGLTGSYDYSKSIQFYKRDETDLVGPIKATGRIY